MYHQKSKRRQLLARAFVYSFMTISVITIVVILMLVILGYSFNRQDGRLEQGGLLQFNSIPSGARVTIDDVMQGSLTPSKASVEAKSHSVSMTRAEYRPWQKTIDVTAGGIGWLSYARLMPNTISTDPLRVFPQVTAAVASPERKWIAIQEDATSPAITLVNIESATPKYTTMTIPSSLITPAQTNTPQSFSIDSWSDNENYLLVKRTYDTDKTEWIVIDRANPDQSVNITTTFAIAASKIIFGERGGRDLYAQTDTIVRRINIDNQTLSGALASNVAEFSVYDQSTVLYTTLPNPTDNNQRTVGYIEQGMNQAETIRSYPAETTNLHIAFGRYFDKRYVAITHGTSLDLLSGTLPRGTTESSLRSEMSHTLASDNVRLTLSRNSRFVVAQDANGYTTYDIELKKTDTTVFKAPATIDKPLQWLDDYSIWSGRGDVLRFYDFDGANQHDIMPVVEGLDVTLSGDNKYVYGLTRTDDGIAFQRGRLILN